MRPVSGWKPRAGSSVVTRHWMAQPFTRMLSWRSPSSGNDRPAATCSCAWTRSTSVISSVTVCSTCSRELTSMK